MRLNEYDAQGEKHKIMYVILLMLLTVGTAVGSVYLIGRGTETGEVLKEYISGVLSGISDEKNSITVFENSLSSGIVMLLVIFLWAFLDLVVLSPVRLLYGTDL